MCDCAKKTKQKLTEHLEAKIKDKKGFDGVRSSCYDNGIIYLAGSKADNIPAFCIPFTVEYNVVFKSGKSAIRKEKTSIVPSYCPFCGEKYDK